MLPSKKYDFVNTERPSQYLYFEFLCQKDDLGNLSFKYIQRQGDSTFVNDGFFNGPDNFHPLHDFLSQGFILEGCPLPDIDDGSKFIKYEDDFREKNNVPEDCKHISETDIGQGSTRLI